MKTYIPELKIFQEEACRHANDVLATVKTRAGYWFNYMPAGSVTIPHSHDDDDELLSAVYYVTVPEDSGDLIIYTDNKDVRISPEEGISSFLTLR
jgi:hypothetical protein